MLNSLAFWTAVVALLSFVLKFFWPDFPFDNEQVLAAILFLLGLVGIYPQFMQRRLLGLTFGDLVKSKAFWTLVAGLGAFVVHFYSPDFPLDEAAILALIVYVLAQFGVVPELRQRGIL